MTAGLRPGETSEQCTTQTAIRLHLPESPLPTTLSPGYLFLVRVNCVKRSTAPAPARHAPPDLARRSNTFGVCNGSHVRPDQQSQGTPMSRGVVSFLGLAARRARRFTRLTADAVAARVSASRKERSFGGNVEKVSPLRAQPPRVSGRGPERGGRRLAAASRSTHAHNARSPAPQRVESDHSRRSQRALTEPLLFVSNWARALLLWTPRRHLPACLAPPSRKFNRPMRRPSAFA